MSDILKSVEKLAKSVRQLLALVIFSGFIITFMLGMIVGMVLTISDTLELINEYETKGFRRGYEEASKAYSNRYKIQTEMNVIE